MVASDSRTAFRLYPTGAVVSYFDGTKKIYQIESTLIAVTGQSSFGEVWVDSIMQVFKEINKSTSTKKIAKNFNAFLSDTSLWHVHKGQTMFMIAGYYKRRPYISVIDSAGAYRIRSTFVSNDSIANEKGRGLGKLWGYKEAISGIRKIYSDLENRSVGGPLAIRVILKDGTIKDVGDKFKEIIVLSEEDYKIKIRSGEIKNEE